MQAGLHETRQGRAARLVGGRHLRERICARGRRLEDQGAALLPLLARQLRRRLGEDADRFHPDGQDLYPEDPLGPDALIDPAPRLWPATDTVPFHYPHPVTGKPIVLDNSRAREGFTDR